MLRELTGETAPLSRFNSELSSVEWRILERHRGGGLVSSTELQKDLSLDGRTVSDILHHLHYEGLICIKTFSVSEKTESILSKITEKGLLIMKYKQ